MSKPEDMKTIVDQAFLMYGSLVAGYADVAKSLIDDLSGDDWELNTTDAITSLVKGTAQVAGANLGLARRFMRTAEELTP